MHFPQLKLTHEGLASIHSSPRCDNPCHQLRHRAPLSFPPPFPAEELGLPRTLNCPKFPFFSHYKTPFKTFTLTVTMTKPLPWVSKIHNWLLTEIFQRPWCFLHWVYQQHFSTQERARNVLHLTIRILHAFRFSLEAFFNCIFFLNLPTDWPFCLPTHSRKIFGQGQNISYHR